MVKPTKKDGFNIGKNQDQDDKILAVTFSNGFRPGFFGFLAGPPIQLN
jgi:hypothetical protein